MKDEIEFFEKVSKKLKDENANFSLIGECLIIKNVNGEKSMPMRMFSELFNKAPKKIMFGLKEQSNSRCLFVIGTEENLSALKDNEEYKNMCSENWKEFIDSPLNNGHEGKFEGLPEKVKDWFVNGDIGSSSEVLFSKTVGLNLGISLTSRNITPFDISDFGRCKKLVDCIPEIDIQKMRYVSDDWVFVIDNWELLCVFLKCKKWIPDESECPRALVDIVKALK